METGNTVGVPGGFFGWGGVGSNIEPPISRPGNLAQTRILNTKGTLPLEGQPVKMEDVIQHSPGRGKKNRGKVFDAIGQEVQKGEKEKVRPQKKTVA